MKLQSFYLAPILVFLTAAATNGGFAVAQETETETKTPFTTPTTTATNNPSIHPRENPQLPQPTQQQQQQQAPGTVPVHQHHSFVRQQPSPIPADERPVEVEAEDEAEVDAVLLEQEQQESSDTDIDTDSETISQQDQGDNDLGIPESNVNVDEPLPLPLHHVEIEVEREQEDASQEQAEDDFDSTAAYADAAPTPTTETFAMKESLHHHRDHWGPNVAEASEHDDTGDFDHQQQQQQQQQQDPAAELDVEQLKRLLQQRQQQHHARDDSDSTITEDDIEDEDDRTLLDIFGEVTKEYLTQNVIPETDAECRWDWRSVRCEPACECASQPKRGDYHLGRSCRLRPDLLDRDDDDNLTCVDVDAATLWLERPATRRIVSLVVQTGQILRDRSAAVVHQVRSGSMQRFQRMQTNVCTELWTMTHAQMNGGCVPLDDLPMTTLQERVLCGPVEFVVCDEDDDNEVRHRHSSNPGVDRGGDRHSRRAGNEPMARRAWADL